MNQPPERELNVGLRHALYNPDRLRVFHATQLLDTGADEMFDRLARLAGSLPRTPFAFITLVDAARSFWKSCIGVDSDDLADRQNAVEESFCQYVINDNKPRIVADARRNELTRHNPSIVGMGIVAWAGYPLRSIEGHVLGTCCVVDTVVRDWTTEEKRSSKGSGRDAPTLYVERASATGWSAGTS